MRKAIISLVVALACLVPAALLANGMPPEATKATTPPGAASEPARVTQGDLQADAPDQYTVVKGDTLWGIAGRFLKDPWKWPQIWQMNREQIKNPHWIYPGDVIRLDRSSTYPQLSLESGGGGTAGEAAGNVVRLEPRVRIEPLETAIPTIPGSAIGPFLTQPLVIEEGGLDGAPSILATEEDHVVVAEGDTAYADRIGSRDGINWQVFRPGIALRDPDSGELLGYEANYIGDARVRRFGSPSTLYIVKARQEINRGDRLAPARETSFPSFVPRAPDKPIRGVIMSVLGGVAELGQYQIITINRGSRDGLEVGHVLASYRRGAILGSSGRAREYFSVSPSRWFSGWGGDVRPVPVVPDSPRPQGGGDEGAYYVGGPVRLPDERNGLVMVFRVFEKMSYAMVMRSYRPIYVGDVLQTP
ncbi:MAG TPA: LysM peptidoglycan-binding domain-containing protein [Usitatibacter sp.]|nr:LysM peptidoglycan-binding domain-containing protein [Usitatibacter sp.]